MNALGKTAVVGCVALLGAAWAFRAHRPAQVPAPQAAGVLKDASPAAALRTPAGLEFPETLKELRVAADAATVTVDYAFKNTGTTPADVKKYVSTCACMAVMIKGGKLHYEPGESGVVRAVFELGMLSGQLDKEAALWLNGDKETAPSVKLTTRIYIPVLVELSPKNVKWAPGAEPQPQAIHITVTDPRPMRIVGVTSTNPAFRHELKTIEEGRKYDLVVTPESTKQDSLVLYRIETDSPIPRFHALSAYAQVSRTKSDAPPDASDPAAAPGGNTPPSKAPAGPWRKHTEDGP